MHDIFWVGGKRGPGLAIVLRPRGDRRLDEDMRALRAGGVRTLVSLLEFDESRWLGIADEPEAAHRAGIKFLSFPIPDAHVPTDQAGFNAFVADLAARLKAGDRIGIHCQGSIGRATVAGACTLVHLGWEPAAALAAIEAARGCPVPDTQEQLHWILAYKVADEKEKADRAGSEPTESEGPEFQRIEPEETEAEQTESEQASSETARPEAAGPETAGPETAESEAVVITAEPVPGSAEMPVTESSNSAEADAGQSDGENAAAAEAGTGEASAGEGEIARPEAGQSTVEDARAGSAQAEPVEMTGPAAVGAEENAGDPAPNAEPADGESAEKTAPVRTTLAKRRRLAARRRRQKW